MNPISPTECSAPSDDHIDAEALNAIASGDQDAFLRLYDRYASLLHSTLLRILKDPRDAEDALQDVSYAIWNKASLYHTSRGRPVTWLISMARNRAIDRLRGRKRRARLAESLELSGEAIQRNTVPISGSEATIRRDTCYIVRTAVLELNTIQREAIEKVYFEGLTQKEYAEQLGEPLGTVKARVKRGLAKLRETITEV